MTGRNFLTLAARLASGAEEADWRTAVSRAYYAAFHTAQSLLTDLGFTVPRDDRAHKYLSFRLTNAAVGPAPRVGLDLDNLRTERNRAAYDLDGPFDAATALQNVQIAEQVVQALAALDREPDRTALTDAVKTCERTVLGAVTWQPPP